MTDTKTKLLRSAAKLFARYGLDGVSTRDLAKRSGVNLCSINYYFGTKQKLYEAVLQDVVSYISDHFVLSVRKEIESAENMPPREEIKYFIRRFYEFLCSDAVSEVQSELLVKELLKPTAAYDQLYLTVLEPLLKRLSGLVANELNLAPESRQAVLQTHILLGQVVMFRIHKTALLRRLGIKKYTPELMEQTEALLMRSCDAVLTAFKEGV